MKSTTLDFFAALDKRYQKARQVDMSAVVDTVSRNSNGQIISATARIQGAAGTPFVSPPNMVNLCVGQVVAVENLGGVSSPIWSMYGAGALGGALSIPTVYQVPDGGIGLTGGTYDGGDLLLGSDAPGMPNFFFDESTGEFLGRLGTVTTLGLQARTGRAFFGRPDSSHVLIDSGNLSLRFGPTGPDKIRLDQSGNAQLLGSLTVGATGNIKGGMTDYAQGSGFFIGFHEGQPKLSIGNDSKFLRWDGSSSDLNLSAITISGPLELEFMKMQFTAISWSQFAIWDGFSDESKRGSDLTNPARVYEDQIDNGADATPGKPFYFTSKTYSDITDVASGTSNSVGSGYLQDDDGIWFDGQYVGYRLIDSIGTDFEIEDCTATPRRLIVTGTPSSGAYKIRTNLPGYAIVWANYDNSAGGDVKIEVSFDGGSNYQDFLNTAFGVDLIGGTVAIANPGRDYVFRVRLTNSGTGIGPTLRNILVCTDPSVWQG